MTDELTPVRCGCGGEAEVCKSPLKDGYCYFVKCERCETATNIFVKVEDAITAWNRAMSGSTEKSSTVERTAKVKEDEWTEHKMLSRDYGKIYYQHDCCCDLYESPYQFCPYCGKKMKRKNHE